MMPKPIILTFVPYYLPGYKSGGPARSIANMADRLGGKLEFRIVTSDRDKGDDRPYPGVITGEWNSVGSSRVFYLSPTDQSLAGLTRVIKNTAHDILYLNGFFNPQFTIRVLAARRLGLISSSPLVLAPRGEFSEGALLLKSRKKRIWIALSRTLRLYQNLTWQASGRHEAADIRREMKSSAQRIAVAPDLPAAPGTLTRGNTEQTRAPGGPLRVCFISRISPMKNLDYALKVLLQVKAPVKFDIYGVEEDKAYWKKCGGIIDNMPRNVSVTYHGKIKHADVHRTLLKHDLFFLPTRGENYGHVIYEALSAGLPVLISDQTPWRNLESPGVGWDLPLEENAAFKAAIESQSALSGEELSTQRRRVLEYARNIANDEKTLSDNYSLFADLI